RSLTRHPMPPRITQQSCKTWLQARVSDRTMVGTPTTHSACWRFRRRGRSTQGIMESLSHIFGCPTEALPAASLLAKGAECREQSGSAAKGQNFLLTFPLIEPAPLLLRVSRDLCAVDLGSAYA